MTTNHSIKIHVLHTGQVIVDQSLPFHEKSLNPVSYTGLFRPASKRLTLPVSAYLIEHPKGKILIDTGWGKEIRTNQIPYMGRFHYMINKGVLPEGQAIDEQLLKMGIKAKDIDLLILTHLHSDHVSGLKLVKDAKKILVNDIEMAAAKQDKLRYIHHMWEGVPIETYAFKSMGIGPKENAFDVFGDGSILLVHTPGHSKGLTSILIKNNNQYVLLASDVGYATKSWDEMIMPGVMVNKEDVVESLSWVRKMEQTPDCIEALANHDANLKPHTIIL